MGLRWVFTTKGEKCHCIREGEMTTLCGIPAKYIVRIGTPGPDNRCGNCDLRMRGRTPGRPWKIRPAKP